MIRYLDDNNPDGVVIGQTPTSKFAEWGNAPVPQRPMPMQANIQGMNMGIITTFQSVVTVATGITGFTTLEQAMLITPSCNTVDFILQLNKPTSTAGLGIMGFRNAPTSINTILANWGNPSSAPVTPNSGTAETYSFVVASGFPIINATITPSAISPNASAEQIFTIQGINAAGTALINPSGQCVGVNMTAGGAGYYFPPHVIFGAGPPTGGFNAQLASSGPLATPASIIGGSPFNAGAVGLTYSPGGNPLAPGAADAVGTAVGLDTPAATAQYPYGSGASGTAVVSGGAVTAVIMTAFGSGYQIAPQVSFIGGNTFSPGMVAHMHAPSAVAGIGFGNIRVAGNYQLGITFQNVTASALTPPAGNYRFLVTNEFPAIDNVMLYQFTNPGFNANTAIGTYEYAVTIPGILASDYAAGVSKPTVQNLAIANYRVSAASLLQVGILYPLTTIITPTAGELYTCEIWRQQPPAPTMIYAPYLTPTSSITASQTGEITMAVTGVLPNTTVHVNGPQLPNCLSIAGSRVSAANQVAVNFANSTSSAITVPTGIYNFEVGGTPVPGALNSGGNYNQQSISLSLNAVVDAVNEIIDALKTKGSILGH